MKNKKVVALVGALAIVVVGVSIFVFAPKDSGSAEMAQEVVEAVEEPTVEIPEEVVEEPEVVEEVEEVPEVEVAEEPEVVEEAPVVEETPEVEESIVEVAETSPEVSEDAGVSTQKEEVSSEQSVEPKQEEVKPAETKPVEAQSQQTKTEPNVNQISTDQAVADLLAQINADPAMVDGGNHTTSTLGECPSSGGAAAQIIVE